MNQVLKLVQKIITEGKNSKADLFFSQDAGALGLLSERGLLQKLPTDLTKDVSPKFKSPTRIGRRVEGDKIVRYSKKTLEIIK